MANLSVYKQAAEQDFEKAFATLAYTELEQKAPGLFPYLVGFQLIKKDDKDSHAIGVFGFRVSGQWYYGPVFWLNGRIKGYELLYIVSQDIFVPLQESWINYLTNRQPYIMGGQEKQTPTELGTLAPDFTIFKRSPLLKSSSDVQEEFYTADKSAMLKRLTHSESLTNVIERMPVKCACTLLRHMRDDEKFAEAMYTFYDPKDILQSVNAVMSHEMWKTSEEGKTPQLFVSGKPQTVAVSHGDACDGVASFKTLTTKEKENLMAGGAFVQDNRDDKSVSEVYNAPSFSKTFQNPTQTGLWRVLLSTGSFETAYVCTAPVSVGKAAMSPVSSVLLIDSKKFVIIDSKGVFAKSQLDPHKLGEFYDGLASPKSIGIGDVGVLVSKCGKMTFMFRVLEVTKGHGGTIVYKVDVADDIVSIPVNKPCDPYGAVSDCSSSGHVDWAYDTYERGHYIQVVDGAASMVNVRETLVVSDDDVKFFKLGTCRKPADESAKCDDWYDFKRNVKPKLGTDADIDYHLRNLGMRKFSMVYDGNAELSYLYGYDRVCGLSASQALSDLITKVGMREKVASEVIKRARLNGRCDALIKSAVSFNQPGAAYDEMYQSPVTMPFNDNIPYPTQTADREPAPIDDATFRQQATAAAAAGQKDVFDVSVLTALARDSRFEDHLRDFIKDIIVGNDRVGRILFLYYWHFDTFAEKYGDDDMVELEDLLKDVFKSAGDLVLFLKQKSVESEALATESVVDL